MERFDLAMERIRQIPLEEGCSFRYHSFFVSMAEFIILCDDLRVRIKAGSYFNQSLDKLSDFQDDLYRDILGDNYLKSIYNPGYMQKEYEEIGRLLSILAAEMRSIIILIYENRMDEVLRVLELFLEIYFYMRQEEEIKYANIEDIIYWYASDYLDKSIPERIRDTFTIENTYIKDIVTGCDFSDLRYLYRYGEYISDIELDTAKYLNSLDEETISKMADTFTEGFIRGYLASKKDLSKKKYISIRYFIGFERVVKKSIENFASTGLEVILTRAPYKLSDRGAGRSLGIRAQGANKQFAYDHRFDIASFYRKAYADRRLAVLESTYEERKEELSLYAGPAVMEIFGEEEFSPINNKANFKYNKKQKDLKLSYDNSELLLQNKYINREEISFTIIAWPIPKISEDFKEYKEIFDDIIRVNTLDSDEYSDMQKIIIDALDKAYLVRIKGGSGNKTDILVALNELKDRDKETNFENCVADVNIPVGEVFTSPRLKGTEGILHVSKVYIGDIQFKDLCLEFKDGMILSYSCKNFENEEENKKLIEDVLLKNHETLAMGEFAIGTNTKAYAVARKYNIQKKLPILIAEKTGPHFAIGDTCYSWEEDALTYNPDGKRIVAKDNEYSLNRLTDTKKAYFGCHTDITIPYNELGEIYTIEEEQKNTYIIKDGKFALRGLEKLNLELLD